MRTQNGTNASHGKKGPKRDGPAQAPPEREAPPAAPVERHEESQVRHEPRGGPLQQRAIRIIGPIASFMAVAMFVSYIPQIMNNLDGHKTSPIQPTVTMINCTLWTIYALWRPKRDWPIAIANIPGIFFGAAAAITGL